MGVGAGGWVLGCPLTVAPVGIGLGVGFSVGVGAGGWELVDCLPTGVLDLSVTPSFVLGFPVTPTLGGP